MSRRGSSSGGGLAARRAFLRYDEPVWLQLYPTNYWRVAEALVKRAEQAGSPVVAVTVDRSAPRNMETSQEHGRRRH